MALSVVYFWIMHRLGRPHYVWDEYLYSVLEEVRVTVCVSVVWDDDERKGEGETRCRLIACSSRNSPRGLPDLTSPSDRWIAINSTARVTQKVFRYSSIKYYNWNLTITFYQSTLPEHLCNVASTWTTIQSTGASHCHSVHRAPLGMLQPCLQVLKTASHAVGPSP